MLLNSLQWQEAWARSLGDRLGQAVQLGRRRFQARGCLAGVPSAGQEDDAGFGHSCAELRGDHLLQPIGEACPFQGLEPGCECRSSRCVAEEDGGATLPRQCCEPPHFLSGPVLRQGGLHDVAAGATRTSSRLLLLGGLVEGVGTAHRFCGG